MRKAKQGRKTGETDIAVELDIDGNGERDISTGVGFFDHMLDLFAKHGLFDLKVRCEGDTWVDDHHTVEDVGIVLGRCFGQALGDKKGIRRYGQRLLPMDEVLCLCAVDLSGRPYLVFDEVFTRESIRGFGTENVREFLYSFCVNCGANLGIRFMAGANDHHRIEALFKALGKAMREPCEMDQRAADAIPSTKGSLD